MRFVTVRDIRSRSRTVWKDLKKERELVLTSNGKPIGILVQTDEKDLEESLRAIRSARAIRAITSMQHKAAERGLDRMTPDEIDAIIRQARKRRAS